MVSGFSLCPGNRGRQWVFLSEGFLTTLSGASKLSCSGATPVRSQWAKERSRQGYKAGPLRVGVLWTEDEIPQAPTPANTQYPSIQGTGRKHILWIPAFLLEEASQTSMTRHSVHFLTETQSNLLQPTIPHLRFPRPGPVRVHEKSP